MLKKIISLVILTIFFLTSLGSIPNASAQSMIDLPAPGMMVNKSIAFDPLQLKGILVNINNPLRFDFLVDKGDSQLYGQPLKEGITQLAKYFLTCLTVPENDLWVNLSPYEKNRIVPENFGVTLMGKDLLEQDYLLKQITASLSYPENNLGKVFWQKVYRKSYELYGTTNIPINTFNKVWITPKSAQVYVQGNAAFVVNGQLDVMLEADYNSFAHHEGIKNVDGRGAQGLSANAWAYSQVLRDVILPQLRQEINEGKNFALVRQVYNALILATWYKRHLQDSVLGKVYVGRNAVRGVDIADRNAKEKIFQQYLRAYKKCVYNYIKEDYDPLTQQTVPRKYASGGLNFTSLGSPEMMVYNEEGSASQVHTGPHLAMATVNVTAQSDGKIFSLRDLRELIYTHPFYQAARAGYHAVSQVMKRVVVHTTAALPTYYNPVVMSMALGLGGLSMSSALASTAMSFFSPATFKNAAMVSPKGRGLVRTLLLSLAVTAAIGVMAPSAQASGHMTIETTFGKALHDAGIKTMPLWGKYGAVSMVQEMAKIADVTHVKPGQQFKIPTEKEVYHYAQNKRISDLHPQLQSQPQASNYVPNTTAQPTAEPTASPTATLPASIPQLTPSQNPVPGASVTSELLASPVVHAEASAQQGSPVEAVIPALPIPVEEPGWISVTGPLNGEMFSIIPSSDEFNAEFSGILGEAITLVTGTSVGVDTPASVAVTGSKPPLDDTNTEILQSLEAPLPWYLDVSLIGLSFTAAGAVFCRLKRNTKLSPVSPIQIVPNPQPLEAPYENISEYPSPGDAQELAAVRHESNFNESGAHQHDVIYGEDDMPGSGSLAELDGLRPQYSLGMPKSKWLKIIKYAAAWISGIGLMAHYSGVDVTSLMASIIGLPLVTALADAIYIQSHESGHALGAAATHHPRRWREIFALANWNDNLNWEQWKDLIFPWRNAQTNPSFIFKNERARILIRTAGPVATILTGLGMGIADYVAGTQNSWLMTLLGPIGVSGLFALAGGIWSDLIKKQEDPDRFECGVAVVMRAANREQLERMGVDKFLSATNGLERRMTRSTVRRGAHSAGRTVRYTQSDGRTVMETVRVEASKRGPRRDLVEKLFSKANSHQPKNLVPDDDTYTTVTEAVHTRYVTVGTPTKNATQPVESEVEQEPVIDLKDGRFTIGNGTLMEVSIIDKMENEKSDKNVVRPTKQVNGHNGDKDAIQLYPGDIYIGEDPKYDFDAMRQIATQLLDSDFKLQAGDTPVIPHFVKFLLNQGNWNASARFAHTRIHYNSIESLLKEDQNGENGILTREETRQIGGVFREVFWSHAQALSRSKWNNRSKTWTDLWVDEEILQKLEQRIAEASRKGEDTKLLKDTLEIYRAQYQKIEEFKTELFHRLKTKKGVPDRIADHWQGPREDLILREFIDTAVKRFFVAGRQYVAKEFQQCAKGTFGLLFMDMNDPNGFTFLAREQGGVVGYGPGMAGAASDPFAMRAEFEGVKFTRLVPLLAGTGEIADFQFNPVTGKLKFTIFSVAKNRNLTPAEIKERENHRDVPNQYNTPYIPFKSEKTRLLEEINNLPRAVASARNAWSNKGSFNYGAGRHFAQQLASLYIANRFKGSTAYTQALVRIHERLLDFQNECRGSQRCSETDGQFLQKEERLNGEDQGKSVLVRLFNKLLDEQAEKYAEEMFTGQTHAREIWGEMSSSIEERAGFLISYLEPGPLGLDEIIKESALLPPLSNKRGVDVLWVGYDNSEQYVNMLNQWFHIFLPGLSGKAVQSSEFVNTSNNDFDIYKVRRAFISSRFGASSQTEKAIAQLKKAIGVERMVGSTLDILSPLSVDGMEQGINPNSKRTNRVFVTTEEYTGPFPSPEDSITSDTLSVAHAIELVMFVVTHLREEFPDDSPFGLNVTEKDIEVEFNKMRQSLLRDAIAVSGKDVHGKPVKTLVEQYKDKSGRPVKVDVHKLTLARSRFFATHFLEGIIVRTTFWGYVLSLPLMGGGIASGLQGLAASLTGSLPWVGGVMSQFLGQPSGIVENMTTLSMGGLFFYWGFRAMWNISTHIRNKFNALRSTYAHMPVRNMWDRVGKPDYFFVTGLSFFHSLERLTGSKLFSRGYRNMSPYFDSRDTDRVIMELSHSGARGTLARAHLPSDPYEFDATKDVLKKIQVTVTGAFGGLPFLKSGARVFTSSRDPVNDAAKQFTSHNIAIGGSEYAPSQGASHAVIDFYHKGVEPFGGMIFGKVELGQTAWAISGGGLAWDTTTTVAGAGSATTRTGRRAQPLTWVKPEEQLTTKILEPVSSPAPMGHEIETSNIKGGDDAQISFHRKGGIDMNSRLMQLNVTGDTTQNRVARYDMAMLGPVINGLVPQVSQIVTVTPEMLKDMLGEGYLN